VNAAGVPSGEPVVPVAVDSVHSRGFQYERRWFVCLFRSPGDAAGAVGGAALIAAIVALVAGAVKLMAWLFK